MPKDFTFEESLSELTKRGLSQPTYEDALLFGEQHPEIQRKAPIMFPHEPVRGAYGRVRVVYLYVRGAGRDLNLDYTCSRWFSYVRVAGVRT